MPDSASPALPFELAPDAADSWLAGLPVDNSRERCRLLFAALQALNASGADSLLHLQILERMRPVAELESGKLMVAFVGKPMPLEDRVRKSAKLSAQFQLELARGFEAVFDSLPEGHDPEEMGKLLQGALLAYEQYVLRLALMYEPTSTKLWASVHGLLQRAARMGLDERKTLGIGAVFKRLVAFRLASANRYEQSDLRRLHELLREQADGLKLSCEACVDGAAADFAIDLTSGAIPGPPPVDNAADGERRFLFTGVLRRWLAQSMQPSTPEDKRLRGDFASRLIVRLGGMPTPAPEQRARQAMVAGGWDAVGSIASKAARLKAAGGSWAGLGDLELMPLNDHGGFGSKASPARSKTDSAVQPRGSDAFGGGAAAPFGGSEGEYPCSVQRAEAPGFYLLETAAKLRGGRLAAINTDNTLLQVGLVGASRAQGRGRLFAFELLANDVTPVRVLGEALPKPVAGLLGKMGGGSEALSLLLPPTKLRSGSRLDVDSGGRRKTYCITRLLEATAEFTQFELVPQASEAASVPG